MRLIIFLTVPFIVAVFSFIVVFLPVYAAYTPTTSDNTCAAGAVAVITTGGLECKLAGDILGAGVTVNSGTLTACSDDELFWTDNGKIKCVALNCPGTNKYLAGFKDGASVCYGAFPQQETLQQARKAVLNWRQKRKPVRTGRA